jgi:hypothetical protein
MFLKCRGSVDLHDLARGAGIVVVVIVAVVAVRVVVVIGRPFGIIVSIVPGGCATGQRIRQQDKKD